MSHLIRVKREDESLMMALLVLGVESVTSVVDRLISSRPLN
jgi:hypothetical protein